MRSARLFIQWHSLVAAAFVAWLWPNDARAASCSFTSVIGANFGTYQVFDATPLDSTGSITVLCNGVLPTDLITIEIDGGSSSNPANRYMLNGLIALNYNLYLDPSRMLIWGNGTNGTSVLGPLAVADQTPTTWTVYGRISPMQNVSAGSYSDTVMVTVQF